MPDPKCRYALADRSEFGANMCGFWACGEWCSACRDGEDRSDSLYVSSDFVGLWCKLVEPSLKAWIVIHPGVAQLEIVEQCVPQAIDLLAETFDAKAVN